MPLPNLPDPRKPTLKTLSMARPAALARICGGMILSGPNACRGSMNEARMRPHFLHSLLIDDGSGLLRLGDMISRGDVVVVQAVNIWLGPEAEVERAVRGGRVV
jgi:hypothetical protein